MRGRLTFFILMILFSCGQTEKMPDGQLKTIAVGDYLFDFPAGFELVTEKGIDSSVGKIKSDGLWLDFEFGMYTWDFGQTSQEYLENGSWRHELSNRFMNEGITYDQTNTPKIDIMSIRPATIQDSTIGKGCDYVAKCKYNKNEFDFAIYLPSKIKQTDYSIDTVDNRYRKVVWPRGHKKGTTGIYLRDLNDFAEYSAFMMGAVELDKKQQEVALKIFKSGRHRSKMN